MKELIWLFVVFLLKNKNISYLFRSPYFIMMLDYVFSVKVNVHLLDR